MFASRRLFRREFLIGITVALVVGCAAFVFGLRWFESLITFHPTGLTAKDRDSPPEGAEIVWFNSVVIESGLSSASSVATSALPWLPTWLHFLGKNRFESARKLTSVRSPVLIAHGDPDETIPTAEAYLLFASANQPKKLLIVPGAGHVVFATGEEYLSQVEQFMRDAVVRARQ
jgi:fermentation-respiration switch protein FrsA (DUF1100 family)